MVASVQKVERKKPTNFKSNNMVEVRDEDPRLMLEQSILMQQYGICSIKVQESKKREVKLGDKCNPDRFISLNLSPEERIVSAKVTVSKDLPIKFDFMIYNLSLIHI